MVKQPTQTRIRRKEKKNVTNAVAHVNSSFNNTVVTITDIQGCLLYTSPSPRDRTRSRMPSSA